MKTNIAKMKCRSSSEIEPDDERKSLKFLLPAIATKQFTRIDRSACAEMEQKYHESCLAPMPIAAYDSRDELLPGKTVQDKDRQVIKEEMMDILNHGAAQDEKSSEENNEMKISKKTLKAKKAELKQLKQETAVFSQELQRCSTMCMHLVDDNKLLMDELKKMCDPLVIEILEAKDPAGKDPQTDRRPSK